ncbi:protein OBERON 4 [Lactuca sativa]|uniref:Protein OBERON 4 n=1 Tax=Lactuca sativa TaxID=4236 RepID=A0A9R1XLP2_LACSA|nr:protein OBERON 4 [Lactuca sativa]KAJ0214369.1 hypothetical protein LSAT_V11C400169310 [Lactuca sativa]
MKRLKSSDDLNSYGGEKGVFKDWGRKDDDSNLHQSSSHRSFHYKSESGKRGLSSSSSSRYERVDDDLKNPKLTRKRSDYDIDSYERRKSYDRYRDSNERGILSSSPRGGYGGDRVHRSESFSGPRRDFPKGFRSERDRSRREGSVSSWRRFGGGKDVEESTKSGSDSARGSKAASEEVGNARSPQGGRDAKSPPWSKDSGSEQSKSSKSLEVKKSESLPEESGNNSEREEGELEPDPEPAPIVQNITEDPPSGPLKHENPIDDKCVEEPKRDRTCIVTDIEVPVPVTNKVNESSTSEDSSTQRTGENEVEALFLSDSQKKDAAEQSQAYNDHKEEAKDVKPEETKPKQVNDTILEVKGENMSMDTNTQGQVTENEEQNVSSGFVNHSFVTKELTHNFKDKGKSVLVSDSDVNQNGSSGLLNDKEIDIEGPSTRGFDLFFTDPVKKSESIEQKGLSKPKDEKLLLEPLELSLRLPSVLLPIGSQNPIQGPDSPSQEMSIQSHASSFQTSSDGFTLSRSFSGSQHYTHNPSCSLTETSFDFEQSVGSRPLFQGVTWQVQPPDDTPKNQEPPPIQMSLSNGNGIFHHSQPLPNAQSLQLHTTKVSEGSYKLPIGLERQLSSNNKKQPSGSQSVGSHETGSEHHKDRKRLMREAIGSLSQTTEMVEPLLAMVVSDPVHIVSRILSEMTTSSLTSLKESVRDVILNPSKRRQFSTFRKSLEKRSDITLEILSKAHTTQIEILVALKTGIQDFLQSNIDTSSSDLAEIFLNIRCRNLTCRSYIPVDECDCKICVQKKGFCSACMCLVCSKFDMASNTCSWVGCDVCLHWCHTDCGIRESYIRNGRSANRAPGQSQTEMQFHCVACDHPSEMFGFVREVFQNFAKGWTAETLSNELEYVRRIFSASEDIRGKRLHEISLQMLTRLSDKANVHQVRSFVMGFLTDDDSLKSENIQIPQEVLKPGYGERERERERAMVHLKPVAVGPREPVFDELDGIVRIKLAEAQMFQMRADDARREAEGLNRIAQAKSKKIDEEFASRVAKLHFSEAEEIRRQKFEELQALENAHQEYFNMKLRMEREIKDLLLKMEATKRNFTSSS